MTKNEYNGWHNYETWLVGLWIDNEQSSQEYWAEQAREAREEAKETLSANARLTGVEPFTQDERATFALEKALKAHFEEAQPEVEGFWADMLNAAMSEVNWHELAAHYIEDARQQAEHEGANN